LPCVAGSGARDSLGEIGGAATLFRDPVACEADLVAQLKAGTVFSVAIGVTPGTNADRGGREAGGRGGDRRGDRRGGDRRDRPGRAPRR
jgi:hypothetical protein